MKMRLPAFAVCFWLNGFAFHIALNNPKVGLFSVSAGLIFLSLSVILYLLPVKSAPMGMGK